jgi:Trehalose and maltose hydrolases (possible phosphorylases)
MAKVATRYIVEDPWKIIERGLDKERNRISESLFSIANEYSGVRGYAEEGGSLKSLRGSYFNGIFEYGKENPSAYKGIIGRGHFMVNSADYLKASIEIDGETLDTGSAEIESFERILDFRTGVMSRSFIWKTGGKSVSFKFERFLSMAEPERAYQKITISSDKPAVLSLTLAINFDVVHWGKEKYWKRENAACEKDIAVISARTLASGRRVASGMFVEKPEGAAGEPFDKGLEKGISYKLGLEKRAEYSFVKYICNLAEKNPSGGDKVEECLSALKTDKKYGEALAENRAFWDKFWYESDIEIDGDPTNLQGMRFCLFQLEQTYHGTGAGNNIGAKGLTGEAYSGHAFWDTEIFCLPFYLFNDPGAAKDLLLFRYRTLENARKRARELDCEGACFPIATLNGDEACDLWQHASLQFQPTTAVAYGIRHYVSVTGDVGFLRDHGLEMLIEISRFLLSRGQWNATKDHFGYYCVMGPDEFQMMVNHNAYTNYLAKKTFEYTLSSAREIEERYPEEYSKVTRKLNLKSGEFSDFKLAAGKTLIPFDHETGLFEQHKGYFDLPHVDINSIPVSDFPLYSHWSYDRIYRNDIIKQPDVLMFLFLYGGEFSRETKRINYEFYEPRCVHESSLSPSIHSILASELGKNEEALSFFGFATRMDLDDYNRNAGEGLHMTSIAAAWLNVVYGFGGVRSDGEILSVSPTLPKIWKGYSFKLKYRGALLKISVDMSGARAERVEGPETEIIFNGKRLKI